MLCTLSLWACAYMLGQAYTCVILNNELSATSKIHYCIGSLNVGVAPRVQHFSAFIVIGTAINQLETKVSLKTICCLRLFVVVYKHVMLQHQRK